MAIRIQRSRAKGSRLPPGTVCVTRPGKWSNPYRVVPSDPPDGRWWVEVQLANINPATGDDVDMWGPYATKAEAAAKAVDLFKQHTVPHFDPAAVQDDLRGADLACWCKPGDPCHADVLLEIANA